MMKKLLFLLLVGLLAACGQDKAHHYERDYSSSYTRKMDSLNRHRNISTQEGGEVQSIESAEPATEPSVGNAAQNSAASTDYSSDRSDDNMRGFDPISEDDTDDNGMSRYMENTDEEGWD